MSTTTQVEAARAAYRMLDEAQDNLRMLSKPELIIERTEDDGVPYVKVTCPACGHVEEHNQGECYERSALADLAGAVRWCHARVFSDDDVVKIDYDQSGDFDSTALLMTCCSTPVDLPAGWEQDGWW